MNCKICLWHFRAELISICFVPRINEPPMMANRMVICLASLSPSCGQLAAKTRQLAKVCHCKKEFIQPFVDIFVKNESHLTKTKQRHTIQHCNDSTHSCLGNHKGPHHLHISQLCFWSQMLPRCFHGHLHKHHAWHLAASPSVDTVIHLCTYMYMYIYIYTCGYLRVTSIYLYHVYLYTM